MTQAEMTQAEAVELEVVRQAHARQEHRRREVAVGETDKTDEFIREFRFWQHRCVLYQEAVQRVWEGLGGVRFEPFAACFEC